VHIVQALVSLNLGGSELVAVELAEHARSLGHRVTVMAAGGPLTGRIQDCGAEHLDWPIGRKRLGTLSYVGRIREWIGREKPDVLHVHSRLPAWMCHLALRKLPASSRPACITSMHGQYSVSRYSAVMAGGDRVIAVSDHIREYTLANYPGTDPNRVVTVHGGISREQFPHGYQPTGQWLEDCFREFPELRGRRLLCLPGRLSRYKGHTEFLELLARLRNEADDIHGLIVGKARPGSRYRDELEGLAQRYGISGHLTFTGPRADMRDWLSISAIVYSLCSDPPEAFGRTVPEALHLGVPVIGWNHGGVRETLAALFPAGAVTPGDDETLFNKSIDFLRHRPEVAPSQAFGLQESMEKTMAVYASALATRTP
jgi:glycosyltransferase involved in cell wall biosynthesis